MPAGVKFLTLSFVVFVVTAAIDRHAQAMCEHFTPLRIKNNYSTEFDAQTKTFGYRALIVNFLYTPKSRGSKRPVTWGRLFDAEETQVAWKHCQQLQVLVPRAHVFSSRLGFDLVWTGHLCSTHCTMYNPLPHRNLLSVCSPALFSHVWGQKNVSVNFAVAEQALRASMSNQPVRYVVEVQFILNDYMRMRKKSHLWCVSACVC